MREEPRSRLWKLASRFPFWLTSATLSTTLSTAKGARAETDGPRDATPRYGIVGRFGGQLGVSGGAGVDVAIDGYRWLGERVAVGAFVGATIGTVNTEGECHYGRHCFNRMAQVGPFVEVHALPRFFVDPWARASVTGYYASGNDRTMRDEDRGVGAGATATVGIDGRVWKLVFGPWASATASVGPNTHWIALGLRFGAHW